MWYHYLLNSMTTGTVGAVSSRVRRRNARPAGFRPTPEVLEARRVLSFTAPVGYPAGSFPHDPVAADFDGSGTMDLAVLDGSTVNLLLNNGDGTFRPPLTSPAGNNPQSLAAGDFDADGHIDLVATTPGHWETAISIFRGDGDGTFQAGPMVEIPGDNPYSLAVGELNRDGQPDLVVTSYTQFFDNEGNYTQQNFLNVLIGQGDGSFGDGGFFYLGEDLATPQVALGDVTGDGHLDVVTTEMYTGLGVWLGNGDGTVQARRYAGFASGGPLRVADLSGDGNADIVMGRYTRLSNGDGTFRAQQLVAPGIPYGQPTSVAVADMNRDGAPDLVVADPGHMFFDDDGTVTLYGNTLAAFLGNGDGSFGSGQPYPGVSRPEQIVVADFNNDGFPDIAATESDPGNSVSVRLNDGDWTTPAPSVTIGDVTVTESNSGTVSAVFTVSLSSAYDRPVSVSFTTEDGTANAISDYQSVSDTLTFAPGERSKTITVLVNGDRHAEPTETFSVILSGATNATIADGQALGTIVDDEPRISISDVSRREGRKGRTTRFSFTVSLSAAYDQPVTVSFGTMDGTATKRNGDYIARSGNLTFRPGETAKTITVEAKGDSRREGDESFYVDLFGNSMNSLLYKRRGVGWILNDD